jgi:hypothetical protein
MVSILEFEQRRKEIYSKHNISFDFFHQDYALRQCPIDRRYINKHKTLEYFCMRVRELKENIQKLIESGEDDYVANQALQRFNAILPNYEQFIGDTEKFVYDYYKRFVLVDGKINEVEHNATK